MLSQSLAYQIFIAPALSSLRSVPIRFFHLQYVLALGDDPLDTAPYVLAGYTVL